MSHLERVLDGRRGGAAGSGAAAPGSGVWGGSPRSKKIIPEVSLQTLPFNVADATRNPDSPSRFFTTPKLTLVVVKNRLFFS